MDSTALVIFAFNRPDHLQKTLEFLGKAEGLGELALFFFIDGARYSKEQARVDEVKSIAANFPHPNKIIHANTENKGLRPSVIAGMNKVFETCTQAVILEDDICVHPDFIKYHLKCLETYKHRQDIWSVSGYVIPAIGKECAQVQNEMLVLAPRASSWGWSTWKDRWSKANWNKEALFEHLRHNWHSYRQTGGDKVRMLLRELKGQSSSWAILWDYNHFMNQAYCIYPCSSLVSNIGLDNSGTHSKAFAYYDVDFNTYQRISSFKPDLIPEKMVFRIFSKLNNKFYRNPLEYLQLMLLFTKKKLK